MSFTDDKLQFFNYEHLRPDLQPTSKIFHDLVEVMLAMCPTNSAERVIAINKLIETKDAFVRACIIDKQKRPDV